MSGRPAANIEAIRRCASEGMTRRDTAARLALTLNTICKYAVKLGLKFHKNPSPLRKAHDDRVPLMVAMYRDGYTLQAIGDQFKVTRERVRQLLTKYHGRIAREGGKAVQSMRRKAAKRSDRNHRSIARDGCSLAERQEIESAASAMLAAGVGLYRTPAYAFRCQRSNSHARSIAWELTLWQWWTIWRDSGKWEKRGRGQGYVMCRKGDVGPYAVGNVFIATAIENAGTGRNKRSGLPIGVKKTPSGRYEALRHVGGKKAHLGTFNTPEMAHAAYLAAAPEAVAA